MRAQLVVLLVATAITWLVRGDGIDDVMTNGLAALNIGGAAVSYFDGNTHTSVQARGYGMATATTAATQHTPFLIASISKVFAGAAVSVLVDQGVITLDSDLCDVLPSDWDWSACRHPSYPNRNVTWRMLVTHTSSLTSGIPSVRTADGALVEAQYAPAGGYGGSAAGNPSCPLDDLVGFYRDFLIDKNTTTLVGSGVEIEGGGAVDWYAVGEDAGGAWTDGVEPGTTLEYSNFAIGYIGALVELASNQTFSAFCKDNIFDRLGMSNTAWFSDELPAAAVEAMPMQASGECNQSLANVGYYCFIDFPSGQLRTSARDLGAFAHTMLDLGAPTLWSAQVARDAVSCQQRNNDGTSVDNCEYGVAWELLGNDKKADLATITAGEYPWLYPARNLNWTKGVMHAGAERGALSQLVIFPSERLFVAVLTNTDGNDDESAQKLAALLLNELRGGGLGAPVDTCTSTAFSTPMPVICPILPALLALLFL